MAKGKVTRTDEIDELKRRYEQLREQRIHAEADLKNANKELDRLKKEAREKYGTDELAELLGMLERMKVENERKRLEYEGHLAELERRLGEVEKEEGKMRNAE